MRLGKFIYFFIYNKIIGTFYFPSFSSLKFSPYTSHLKTIFSHFVYINKKRTGLSQTKKIDHQWMIDRRYVGLAYQAIENNRPHRNLFGCPSNNPELQIQHTKMPYNKFSVYLCNINLHLIKNNSHEKFRNGFRNALCI